MPLEHTYTQNWQECLEFYNMPYVHELSSVVEEHREQKNYILKIKN